MGLFALTTAILGAVSTAVEDPFPWDHDHWAVLIAGSSGYGNYRHQADVCHAYQIVKAQGVKEEHIIVLAVDDIANSEENPYPGQVFNKPTPEGTPGVDVYAGCTIDYSGSSVTPDTFVKVLTGDTEGIKSVQGSGKVLQSTSKSRVFVNFVDHGGVNIIGFPETVMHAKELIAALQKMHDTNMYKELVFYLEACESGSMFATLPADINIYATSAANGKESSWGTYCMPNDKVDGKEIRSCLGDLYSVNWMEDSDASIAAGETIATQFDRVKQLTNKSHVQQFGDQDITGEPTSNFQGMTDKAPSASLFGRPMVAATHAARRASSDLPSPEAELASAYDRFVHTGSAIAGEELMRGVRERMEAKTRFEAIAKAVTGSALTGERRTNGDIDCHFAAHKAYVSACGEWASGALKHSADLSELCVVTGGDSRAIVAAIRETCAA